MELLIDLDKVKTTELESVINDNLNLFNTTKSDKLKVIEENIDKFKQQIEDEKTRSKKIFDLQQEEVIPKLQEYKNDVYKFHTDKLQKDKDALEYELKEFHQKITDNVVKSNEILNKVNGLKNQIDSDICGECKRPIGLTPEDIESKEKEKTELNCKSENQAEVKNQVKDVKIKEEPFITCVVVHLSCGWDSFICGYSWFEIITDSMDADERVCG